MNHVSFRRRSWKQVEAQYIYRSFIQVIISTNGWKTCTKTLSGLKHCSMSSFCAVDTYYFKVLSDYYSLVRESRHQVLLDFRILCPSQPKTSWECQTVRLPIETVEKICLPTDFWHCLVLWRRNQVEEESVAWGLLSESLFTYLNFDRLVYILSKNHRAHPTFSGSSYIEMH